MASPLIPGVSASTPLLLGAGKVPPVTGPAIVGADVLITNGKITAIAPRLAIPASARIIKGANRHVYPGLIATRTSLGLQEISAIAGTRDVAEAGQINPNARAQVVVDPDNSHLGVTLHYSWRASGVLRNRRSPHLTDLRFGKRDRS